MPPHPVIFAPLIALLTMAIVGLLSLGGSLTLFAFDSMLYRQYLLLLGQPLIVRSPFELLTWLLSVGTAFSGILVLVYTVGSRIGTGRTS